MASGPDHYREAERLIQLAESCDWTTEFEPYREPAIRAAQVHATLALAAATAHGLPAADWPDALEAKVVEDEPS